MKLNTFAFFIAFIALSTPAVFAQQDSHNMKDMKNMEHAAEKSSTVHSGVGVVNRIQAEAGIVVLKHEPIPSLDWPVMTMGFYVNDKAMLDKLEPGKKVEFEFIEKGSNYVITSIK